MDDEYGEVINDLAQRITELENRFKVLSTDLTDSEDLLEGHAVLIRQLAARVGLSLYEQQRILSEPSNKHHQHGEA